MIVDEVQHAAVNRHQRELRVGERNAVPLGGQRQRNLLAGPEHLLPTLNIHRERADTRVYKEFYNAVIALRFVQIRRPVAVNGRPAPRGIGGNGQVNHRHKVTGDGNAYHGNSLVKDARLLGKNPFPLNRDQVAARRQRALQQNLRRVSRVVHRFVRHKVYFVGVVPVPVRKV